MSPTDRISTIAEQMADNKILTLTARVSMAFCALIGAPLAAWFATSVIAHGNSLTEVRSEVRSNKDRIHRIEAEGERDRRRAQDDLRRLNEIDRLLGQVEERSRGLLREIDTLRRRASNGEGSEIIR